MSFKRRFFLFFDYVYTRSENQVHNLTHAVDIVACLNFVVVDRWLVVIVIDVIRRSTSRQIYHCFVEFSTTYSDVADVGNTITNHNVIVS